MAGQALYGFQVGSCFVKMCNEVVPQEVMGYALVDPCSFCSSPESSEYILVMGSGQGVDVKIATGDFFHFLLELVKQSAGEYGELLLFVAFPDDNYGAVIVRVVCQ